MSALKYISFFITLFLFHNAQAKNEIKILSAQQLIEIVKQHHPIARQAGILIENAKADITLARGGFDPVFKNGIAEKTFDGINYYQHQQTEISIPTWFGVEINGGIENLTGNRIDPSNTRGETNYIGVSIPLAQNLLMDERRAALKTAKIFRQASDEEQRNILNNLLLDALKSYWYWTQHYQVYKILNDAVLINEKRFELIKSGYQLGELPAIDTTEALTQLQNFQVQRENALMQFQNASLDLSVFLWNQNDQPYNLPVDAIPADELQITNITFAPLPILNDLVVAAKKNHPELQLYDYKINALVIDKKLKFQKILPEINIRYNHLGKGYNALKRTPDPLFENNYQYGLTVGIPLRLSEGRGDYRKAKLKIIETQLELNLKQAQIENKVKSYFNQLTALKNQVTLQEKAYRNYVLLQRGEETRFQAGESSLFLINTRENKALEALQKLQELSAKYQIGVNELQWASGLLLQ